jgi:hypothetical protein
MSGAGVDLCIESLDGSAEPAVLRFVPGEKMGPMHVGVHGKWRVTGEGVADQHASLYFDGTKLFLRSVEGAPPAFADGQELPTTDWVPLVPPCNIVLGSATLLFKVAEVVDYEAQLAELDADKTAAVPMAEAKDSTRLLNIDAMRAEAAARRSAPGPAAGDVPAPAPSWSGAYDLGPQPPPSYRTGVSHPGVGPAPTAQVPPYGLGSPPGSDSPPSMQTPFGLGPPPSTSQPGTDTAPSVPTPFGTSTHDQTLAQGGKAHETVKTSTLPAANEGTWKRMSFPQKMTAILFIPMVASVIVIFTDVRGLGQAPAANQPAATSSAAAGADSAAPSGSGEAPAEDDGGGTETAGTLDDPPEEPPDDDGTTEAPDGPDAPATAEAAATADPPKRKGPVIRPKMSKTKSLERQAVDAVARASYAEAAELYEKLAKENPKNDAFAAAAAITRAKAQGKGHSRR